MYIAIAGNIGSGKTSLTEILSRHYGWTPYYEDTNNPYIGDFYEDMERWAFNLQIYFLNKRLKQLREIMESSKDIILDRTIYEDAHIFATNLHNMGLMHARDYQTYMELFSYAETQIRKPDLLIYLKANETTLVSQIHRRGRVYESSINEEYLQLLNECYRKWIATYPGRLLTIDVDKCDFILNPDEKEEIIRRIDLLKKEF